MRKFILLTIILIILPIILGTRYNGYDSYKQYYYNNYINRGRWRASEVSNRNDVNKEIKSRSAASRKYANLESSFIFPGDELQTRSGGDNDAKIGQATSCARQTFCENVPNYPEEFVSQALAANSSLMAFVREDIINIAPRVDTNDETLCLSEERVIFPKSAINSKEKWLYILQLKQSKFYQGVRIETCLEENNKCRLVDGFAEGYITACNQKYIFHELSAISDDGKVVRDYFRFPASCCCHVRFNIDTLIGSRM